MSRRRGHGCLVVTATVCAALLAGVLLAASASHGLGVTPDSVSYLRAATDLAEVRAPTDASGARFVGWPPLYPALVALTALLAGQDAVAAARILQAVLVVVLVLVFAGVLRRFVPQTTLQVTGVLMLVVAPPVFLAAGNALSEVLFMVLVLGSLWAIAESRRAPDVRALLIGAAALAAAAALTRYVGVLVIGVGAVSLLPRRRVAAGFAVAASAPVAAWLIGNQLSAGTLTGRRSPAGGTLGDALRAVTETAGHWAVPGNTIPLVVGALALAGLVTALVRTRPTAEHGHLEILPFWLFAATYPVLLVLLASLVAFDRVDGRLLAPAWPPMLVIGLVAVGDLLRTQPPSRRRRATALVSLGVAAFLVAGTFVLARDAERLADHGGGYASTRWDRSALMAAVATLPASDDVATNAPYALTFRGGRPARDVDDIARGAYLAWFDDPERPRGGAATQRAPLTWVAQQTALDLRLEQELDDGRLFRVVGPDPAE